MKKLLVIFTICLLCAPATFADGDLWDNYGDQNTYGQKPVSDKEFNSTIERLKNRKKKKKNKNIPKGEEFHQANETKFINENSEELPILLVPLKLAITNTDLLPMGYYQVVGEKKNGYPRLKLYQSKTLMAEFPAIETNDDFNEKEIQFVRLLPNNEHSVKIIFGSIDFNAYTIVNIAE